MSNGSSTIRIPNGRRRTNGVSRRECGDTLNQQEYGHTSDTDTDSVGSSQMVEDESIAAQGNNAGDKDGHEHVDEKDDDDRPAEEELKGKVKARHYFLTFPQCDTTKEEAMKRIKDKWNKIIEKVVVGHEKHKDEGDHLHIYLGFKSQHLATNTDHFDFIGGKHGNYQKAKNVQRCIAYSAKDDDVELHGITHEDVVKIVDKWKKIKRSVAYQKRTPYTSWCLQQRWSRKHGR